MALTRPTQIRCGSLKKAEAAFKVLPEPLPTFDHFTAAAWLILNLPTLDAITQPVNESLDRAEKLFEAVNAAIQTD